MSRVFGFTGIPGTGVQESLSKVAKSIGARVKILSIDEYVWDSFAKDARANPDLRKQTELSEEEVEEQCRPNWWQMLTLPNLRVRHYWRAGAQRALEEVKEAKEDLVFVTFHAGYYSDSYRWRLSAVDPVLLQRFGISAFFTFIDDSFDVHLRRKDDLQSDRMILNDVGSMSNRLEDLVRLSCENLIRYIGWRQEEIMLTDLFAAACGQAPSLVFAVKHPIETLRKLLDDPGFSYYLSHPITAIRATRDFTSTENFREIQRFSSSIRQQTTIIEPTTIDELRILSETVDDVMYLLPDLGPRWPMPDEVSRLVYAPPGPFSDHDWDSICATENIIDLNLADEYDSIKGADKHLKDTISSHVRDLSRHISEDITWRDHHLVDQTRRLIVFRPVSGGVKSRGVQREIEYYAKMKLTGEATFDCIVCHPDDDKRKGSLKVAQQLLEVWASSSEVGAHVKPSLETLSSSRRNTLLTELGKEIYMLAGSSDLANKLVSVLEGSVRIEPRISESGAMGAGKGITGREKKAEVRKTAVKLAEKVLKGECYIDSLAIQGKVGLKLVADDYAIIRELSAPSSQSH
jgi:hypothetical protein